MARPFLASVVVLDEVASTSDVARSLVADPRQALPLAVRALRQTRGRGRGTNAWWSDEGSLTVTIALDPRAHGLTTAHEPRLALAAAVALIEAVEGFGPTAQPLGVRWPNDVEAAGRKFGGVLPERVETAAGTRLLVGIGFNVSTRLDDAPEAVRAMAGSLAEIGDGLIDPGSLLEAFVGRFATVLPRLSADDPSLAARWAGLDALSGAAVRVDLGTRVVEGIGRGIDAEGALLLTTAQETLRVFGGRVLRGG